MKRYLIVMLGSISVLFSGCASDHQMTTLKNESGGSTGIFRGITWGSDKEEVEKREKSEDLISGTSADELVYDGKLLGKIPVSITYHFKEGKLRRGTYQAKRPGSVMEYTLFRIILSRKYGRPSQSSGTPDMIETNWITQDTEIDLLAEGSHMKSYSLKKPEVSRSVELASLQINYYDRSWFAQGMEKTVKEDDSVQETESYYQKLIGDWVQEYPSYRSCVGFDPYLFPGDPMFLPEDEYMYEPGSSDSDF